MIHHSLAQRPRALLSFRSIWRPLLLGSLLLALIGCKSWFNREDPLETLPVEEMYATAKAALEGGNLGRASRYYQRLIARFPYGRYTEQAQLELAYAQHLNSKPEDALSGLNRFIKTYPAHQQIAYAYYLKALVNFDRGNALLDRFAGIDSTQRDQGSARQSFNDFAEVVRRFPATRYAEDSRQRMVYLRNRLARHEINVAAYYLRREAYVAAAQRGEFVLEQYPQSAYQADALAVMAEAYSRLGQTKLAEDARRVLQQNDPDHPYFAGAWPAEPSWWRKLIPWGEARRG